MATDARGASEAKASKRKDEPDVRNIVGEFAFGISWQLIGSISGPRPKCFKYGATDMHAKIVNRC